LDSTFQVIDTITPLNGYDMDPHEFILARDDTYWVLAYDARDYDMSQLVPGGSPNAVVIGCLIQNFDQAQNLLFEWSSWDHMDILDCDTNFVDLTDNVIDYVHANSLAIDYEGNLFLSSRCMNEITKIDIATGDIIWRWGGNANQFTFQDTNSIFYGQHTIQWNIESDSYTLFDNGNFHSPPHSTGKEFELDQDNLTATLIKTFDHDPVIYINAMGGMQRMDNGTTIINWTRNNTILSEYDAEGEIVFEIAYVDSIFESYRINKVAWRTSLFDFEEDEINFQIIPAGDSLTQEVTVVNDQDYEVIINGFNIVNPAFVLKTELPVEVAPNDSETFKIMFKPLFGNSFEGILSLFHATDTSRIAQQIRLKGATFVGIDEYLSPIKRDIIIAPNPSTDGTMVSLADNRTFSKIKVLDSRGLLIIDRRLPDVAHFRIEEGLKSGVYFIYLLSRDGSSFGKMVVQ
jgi:hypothetical protein